MSEKDPFKGLERKRLPSIHLITSLEGGIPLREALAGFFFIMLHDKVEHACLVKDVLEEWEKERDEAIGKMSSPDSAFLASIFSTMSASSLAGEEWSYLSDDEAFSFYLLADAAIEQTQRWIMEGVQRPYTIPHGPCVTRPTWAKNFYDSPGTREQGFRVRARETVKKLQDEIK